MGAAGLERAQTRFSAERMVQQTVDVYRKLARSGHRELERV
jgi:hypothetical protein